MTYKVTVKVLTENAEEDTYSRYNEETVFKQILEDLDISKLAIFLNQGEINNEKQLYPIHSRHY